MTTNTQTAAASYRKKNVSHIQRHLIPSYIFLIIVSFISVFPFYWMISAATNKSLDVANGKLTFGTYAAENFIRLTTENDLWGTLGNSFLYALVQAVLALFICSLAGFGFELYHDKAKDRLFGILLCYDDPAVSHDLEDEASEHRMGIYPSVHLNSVPDYDVSPEFAKLSDGDHGGCPG